MDTNASDRILERERLIADAGNPPGESKELVKRSAWERVQLARHPQRPHTLDYIPRIFTGFQEIHGDRLFGDDPAIVAGYALFRGAPV